MAIEGSYNFHRVSEKITTSGVVGADRLAALGSEGYDAVVDLLPEASEYSVADEASIVAEQGLDYVHIPVDFAAPTIADLDAFTDALDRLEGRRVHVHCAANFRVTAFYGLYAVAKGLQSAAEADELARLFWDPADDPVWVDFIARARRR